MRTLLDPKFWRTATPEGVKQKIESGQDIHARDEHEWTPLIVACIWNKNCDAITALIANGADVNTRDENGSTALMFASNFNENPDIITTLIKHGADIKAHNKWHKTAWDYGQQNVNVRDTQVHNSLQV